MNLFFSPESKASRTAKLLAFESGGRARWTPRDYAALAREGYLTNAVVHRAVRLVAENAASCPLLLYEGTVERDQHPLLQLLARPNPRQDGASFFEALYAHLLLAGNAYIESVVLDGAVRELYALRPDRMKVVPGPDGWPQAYEYAVGGRSVRFDQLASDVPPILHLTFFHPLDDHYGLAPLEAAAVATDDVVQIGVADTALTVPPATPADGERYIVASGATGAWAGRANAIAVWEDGAWRFFMPKAGWCAWSAADSALLVYDGTNWGVVSGGGGSPTLDNLAHLGVNATVSGTNLLTVRSNAALFNAIAVADGGSGDARLQISKEARANTASVFFSDAFSGRAEFGLTGDDDFHLKVSADGAAWRDAMKFDCTSGRVSFPSGGVRELLTANRYYYVRSDGSDTNNGLTDASGGAFLTIQAALNAAAALDCSIYNVTVQVRSGSYGNVILPQMLGSGTFTLVGDTSMPGNVTITGSSANAITGTNCGQWTIGGFKVKTTGAGAADSLRFHGMCSVFMNQMEFSSVVSGRCHISLSGGAIFQINIGYTISAGAGVHWNLTNGAGLTCIGQTITLSGTPAFTSFLNMQNASVAAISSNTYSGSATGGRYSVTSNSVASTGGATLPGNSAGSTSSGGQYI